MRRWMRWIGYVVVPTGVAVAVVAAMARVAGLDSIWFAFVVVWAPMTALGTAGRVVRPRLPASYHRLRPVERSGRIHELLGARVVKAVLRRPPISWFNPDLHLPAHRTATTIRHLDQRMRDAEASHAVLGVSGLLVAAVVLTQGWWATAAWTLLFDLVMNGWPVVLQRYNRALLARRHSDLLDPDLLDPDLPDPDLLQRGRT